MLGVGHYSPVRCIKLEKPQRKVTLITHEFYTFCAKVIQHVFRYERKSVKFEGIPKVATPPPLPEEKKVNHPETERPRFNSIFILPVNFQVKVIGNLI